MGYPMTFKRVLNRNRLHDGRYDEPPAAWAVGPGRIADDLTVEAKAELLDQMMAVWQEQTTRVNNMLAGLAGDLRRLEADVVDEDAICKHISARLGVDRDLVAAVLKEFIQW